MKADGKAASAAGVRAPLRFAPSASAISSNFAGVAGADFIFNRSHANTRARSAQMHLLKLTAVSALLLASTQALALGSGGNGSGISSAGLGIDVGAINAAGAGSNPGVAAPRFLSGPGMGGPIAGLIAHFGHIPVPSTPQKNETNNPIPGIDVVVRKESGGSAINTTPGGTGGPTPQKNEQNNPIPGIDVVVRKQPGGSAINTTTDDHGGFTLGNLKAGTYTVAVNPPAPNQGQPPHLATQSTIVNGPDTIKVVTTFVPAQPGQTQNNGPITVTVPRDGMNITGVVVSSDTPKSAENFLRIEGHIGRDK